MANDSTIPARLRGPSDNDLLQQAQSVHRFGEDWYPPFREYPILRSFSVYPPKHRGDKFLVVLKAYGEEGDLVAFYKASDLMAAIAKSVRRLLSGTTEWKPETPYRDRRA